MFIVIGVLCFRLRYGQFVARYDVFKLPWCLCRAVSIEQRNDLIQRGSLFKFCNNVCRCIVTDFQGSARKLWLVNR